MPKGRGRPQINREVEIEAEELLRDLYSVPDVEARLVQKYGSAAPSKRQLYQIKARITPRDASEPWVPASEIVSDRLALVPPVLVAVVERTKGQRRHVTCGEAQWITTVRLMAPDLDAFGVYLVAREYMVRNIEGRDTAVLDSFIVFAPWRSEEQAQRYYNAVYEGWVPPPLSFLDQLVDRDFKANIENLVIQVRGGTIMGGRTPRELLESFLEAKRAKTGKEKGDGK